MSKELRPMRGSIAERDKLVFPYMASPKYDGVRCFIKNGVAYTKSGKPFANKFIQKMARNMCDGLDGELICGDPLDPYCFRKTTSEVRRVDGIPKNMKFYVFDVRPSPEPWNRGPYPASERYDAIKSHIEYHLTRANKSFKFHATGFKTDAATKIPPGLFLKLVPSKTVFNIMQLDKYEAKLLKQGYEGVMLRAPNSPYKYGQATVKENYLLKLKRFLDAEAAIEGFVEFNHNENVAFTDAQGFTKRSSSKAGKRPGNKLGKFIVRAINGPYEGKTFEVGTGYTDAERRDFWERRLSMVGDILTFRSQEVSGGYDLPRIPTYVGMRMPEDLSD